MTKIEMIQSRIMERMQDILSNEQLQHLENVLAIEFHGIEVQEECTQLVTSEIHWQKILRTFIASKRIENCSPGTLERYNDCVVKLVTALNKRLQDITTNDIRYYLAMYQEQRKISMSYMDTIRRYLSSFFAWISDEGYISRNPMRRLKKIKVPRMIKKPFTQAEMEHLRASGGKRLNLISDAETNDSSEGFSSGAHHSMGHTNIYGNLYVADSFRTAGTKQAVRQTENYGEKGVYCYETPTPHFGDIGSGEISEDGKCYIDIEDILKEMINTEMQYYVFLQKCGEGDLYVSECFPDYFIVTGTPGLRFFWELKAKQKGYEYNRYEGEDRVVGFRKIAYDEEYIAETEKLIEEREEI